jgi:hypothetical protein
MVTPETAQVVPVENATDPFSQGAFDKKVGEMAEKIPEEKIPPQRQVTNDKFGIKIVRGTNRTD